MGKQRHREIPEYDFLGFFILSKMFHDFWSARLLASWRIQAQPT